MPEVYEGLFDRIRNHCRQRRWYGPDAEAPEEFVNRYERSFSLTTGKEYVRDRWGDPRIDDFPYAPATESELQATEARLGLPLPSVLHALYTTVANGGFGPAYGLVGAMGGAPSADVRRDKDDEVFMVEFHSSVEPQSSPIPEPTGSPVPRRRGGEVPASQEEKLRKRPGKDRTLAATLWSSAWRMPESLAQLLEREPDRYLECEEEPDGWVTLCHWGCGIFSKLDLRTGRIFVTYGVTRHDVVRDPMKVAAGDISLGIEYQAPSVETWLEMWLREELNQGNATKLTLMSDLAGS